MSPNPFSGLLHSRKFWLLILDTLIAGVTYFVTKYAAPAFVKDALFFIGLLQPVFIALIAAITSEDNAERKKVSSIADSQIWVAQEKAKDDPAG